MKQLFIIVMMALLNPAEAIKHQHFDPATDPVAGLDLLNRWHLLVSEQTLVQSAQSVTPGLTGVTHVYIGEVHGKPHLCLKGALAEDPENGCTVMISLKENSNGLWVAGQSYQICSGNSCNTCGFDEYWGCSCERYAGTDLETESRCDHTVSTGSGLGKID
ncbi:MAG: hypothetical protein ACKOCH_18730 [Bacteroidota bacterium]